MKLSDKAISEFRLVLQKKYNSDFGLKDTELNKIGLFLLTVLAERLKLEMQYNQYATPKDSQDIY